jgi:hypothetical protein
MNKVIKSNSILILFIFMTLIVIILCSKKYENFTSLFPFRDAIPYWNWGGYVPFWNWSTRTTRNMSYDLRGAVPMYNYVNKIRYVPTHSTLAPWLHGYKNNYQYPIY